MSAEDAAFAARGRGESFSESASIILRLRRLDAGG